MSKNAFFFISRQINMVISQAMLMQIVSIDRTHNVRLTNGYNVKVLCILKLVRTPLVEPCQSRRIL